MSLIKGIEILKQYRNMLQMCSDWLANILQAYIQQIYNNENRIIIICFLQEQAKIFLAQIIFEVDMSFKHIIEKNMNEIIFAVWLKEHDKSISI